MNFLQNKFLLMGLVLVVAGCLLSCSGGGKKCVGILSRDGKTYNGAAKNEADAKLFSCNKYCRDDDPGYAARYKIWVSSPKGVAAGSPSKEKAIYEDKGLLDYVTLTCAKQCVQDGAAGKFSLTAKCQ